MEKARQDHAHPETPFWTNNGDLCEHLAHYLKQDGPPGLRAENYLTERKVTLKYSFPDSLETYDTGAGFLRQGQQVTAIGSGWPGVEKLCGYFVQYMIPHAIQPDGSFYQHPDQMETIPQVLSVRLFTQIRPEIEEAIQPVGDVVYQGDLGSPGQDSLRIALRYDDSDTALVIRRGAQLSYLELAGLKLYQLRSRLVTALSQQFGDRYQIVVEGEEPAGFVVDPGKKVLQFAKLDLILNHPNQDALFVHQVNWKLGRTPK